MSQLLHNIESIIRIFDKYAKENKDCTALSKEELKQLIQKEFAEVIVNPHDPETIETVLQLLDTDSDGKVDFEEFTVLVFKVAKACYKEVQRCQDGPAEGLSDKGVSNTQLQDEEPPKEDSHIQSTTAPENAPEDTKLERTSPEQEGDPKSQLSEELSLTDSTQRENKDQGTVKQEATHEEKRAEQDHAQTFHQDPQTTTEEARGQDIQEPLTPESQQRTNHPSSQAYQTEEDVQAGHQEVKLKEPEQDQAMQPPAHEGQQPLSQNETRKPQTEEQDSVNPKPKEALEEEQGPNCEQAQGSQTSEGRSTCQIIQDPQAALLEHQEDKPLTSEQSPVHRQEEISQGKEVPIHLQEAEIQEQDPNYKLEEDSKEEPAGESSQGTSREAQEPAPVQQEQEGHKSLTTEQHPAGQQEQQGQESEQVSAAPERDPSNNKPKENPVDQGPRRSSARQPCKTSWSHQHSES